MKRLLPSVFAAFAGLLLVGCSDHVAGNPNPDAGKDTGGGQDMGGGGDTPADAPAEGGGDVTGDAGKDTAGDKPSDVGGDVAGATCASNTECGAAAYCEQSCAMPTDTGMCVVVPSDCTKESKPVCGCDKKTYENDCLRQMARVAKYFDGACDGGGTGGGGGGGGMGGAGGGAPTDVGVACPGGQMYCSCTGKCYDPACLSCCMGCAEDAGAPTDAAPVVCGGIVGMPCGKGEFCEYPAAMCSSADITGECRAMPEACPLIYDPVCGCDGKTYGNDCERQAAGVSKDYDGAC